MKMLVTSLFFLLTLVVSSHAQELPELTQATFDRTAEGVVLQLNVTSSTNIQFFSKTLPGDAAGNSIRYYVDLYPLKLSRKFQMPTLTSDPGIKQIRWAQNETDKVRVVFDLISAEAATGFRVEKNTQGLVITNVKANEPIAVSVPAPTPAPIATPAQPVVPETPAVQKPEAAKTEVVTEKKQRKIRIILDPGHGGDDPGAHGKRGTLEKNVTLDVALKVRRLLQKNSSYEIFMTREKDATLQLLDRTKYANKMNGDLFVSIHANASPKRTSRGVSTYFLNNADDQESLRVAMRENGELDPEVLGQPSNKTEDYYLEVMKASMVKNFHTTQSTDLARAVQLDLLKTLRQSYSDVIDLGVRSARFYVLTGATMPAILVETSFISHPEEEKRLASPKYQESLAAAVVSGIESFMKNRPEFESTHGVYLSEETTTSKKKTSRRN